MTGVASLGIWAATLAARAEGPSNAPPPPTTTTPTSAPTTSAATADIEKLIADLDADQQRVRTSASFRLNNQPGSALPAVEAALRRPDLGEEVRQRLEAAARLLRPRARTEAARAARDAFIVRTLHDAYARGGHADPRWDGAAHRAIDAYLKLGRDPLHGPPEPRRAAAAAFGRAAELGCDDPLLRALAFAATGEVLGGAAVAAPADPASRNWLDHDAVRAGNYPPLVKFIETVGFFWSATNLNEYALRQPVALLPEVLRTPEMPPGVVEYYTYQVSRIYSRERDPWRHLAPFVQAYAASAPRSVDPLCLETTNRLNLASRSKPYGTTQVMADNVAAAERAARKAYELDPQDPRAPAMMITVLLHKDGGADANRREMETWFDRTVALDPDFIEAYRRKFEFVADRDDTAALLAFGRECLATRNWRAGVPDTLLACHARASLRTADRAAYYRQPAVWRDCTDVFYGTLLNFPDNRTARSEYAKLAAACGKWAVARDQFAILGEAPDLGVFVSFANYDYLRKRAVAMADAPDAPVAPDR